MGIVVGAGMGEGRLLWGWDWGEGLAHEGRRWGGNDVSWVSAVTVLVLGEQCPCWECVLTGRWV